MFYAVHEDGADQFEWFPGQWDWGFNVDGVWWGDHIEGGASHIVIFPFEWKLRGLSLNYLTF